MKILFSPSEAKRAGGDEAPFSRDSFIWADRFGYREEIVSLYNEYMSSATIEQRMKLLGTKKQSVAEHYSVDIFAQPTMKAVERYSGVGYEYLDYASLDSKTKEYIDSSVVIFSNLFGAAMAGDRGLPDYKLKQGEKIDDIAPEQFYKKHFTSSLDEMLGVEPYLDLRAGFYNKFYKPSTPYTTLKFLKDGKVVSHWAKAYRGITLRAAAMNSIQSIDEFIALPIEGLQILEIQQKGIHSEVIYEIV